MPAKGWNGLLKCPEQDHLEKELVRLAMEYAQAAQEIAMNAAGLDDTAYTIAKADVERLRVHAEKAREALMKHRAEHGC